MINVNFLKGFVSPFVSMARSKDKPQNIDYKTDYNYILSDWQQIGVHIKNAMEYYHVEKKK